MFSKRKSNVSNLKEIFSHIEELKNEQNKLVSEKNNFDQIPDEDIFEIVSYENEEKIDSNLNKNHISKMYNQNHSHVICDFCEKIIALEKNLSGLSIKGNFFLCDKCCESASNDELSDWANSKIADFKDVKPIALYLMEKKEGKNLFLD